MAFGWEEALAIANPIGWGPALYKYATADNGYRPSGPSNRKPMMATDVNLLDPLKGPLGDINKKGQSSLSNALASGQNQARTSQIATGRPEGQYIGETLGRANTMASRGIEDALGGVLGGASLQDLQAQKEFEANMALVNEIAAMNEPTLFQEVLSGIGGGANTGLQFKSLYDALGRGRGGGGSGSSRSLSPNLSVYDPYSSGYGRYGGGY